MNKNLSEPLFHGTAATFQPGDQILPATTHGGQSHWGDTGSDRGQPSREHAFATSDEDQAWHFARHAAAASSTARLEGWVVPNRARVYGVEPNAQMRPGAHKMLKEYIAPSFKVGPDVHDIMPGRQGTLTSGNGPAFNWNPFRDQRHAEDANHPSNDDAQYTTPGSRNAGVYAQQEQAHTAFKSRVESLGQTALFSEHKYSMDEPQSETWFGDHERALKHDTRQLVANGQAEAPEVDEDKMAKEWVRLNNARRASRQGDQWRARPGNLGTLL